ncbi:MAG TPA: gamma-glutamyltransferase, partial [Anseongella sp.]
MKTNDGSFIACRMLAFCCIFGVFGTPTGLAQPGPSSLPSASGAASSLSEGFENGLVVSAHPVASAIGLEILQAGGNAVDAAVAVQFALAVVYPNAGNLGGGGFMVIRQAEGTVASLDFREMAPGKAHRDLYLDENKEVIPGLSLSGHLAAGVPGTVAGMGAAHEKYGKLSWEELISPSVRLARNGFALTASQVRQLNAYQDAFLKHNPGSGYFIREHWAAGDTLK